MMITILTVVALAVGVIIGTAGVGGVALAPALILVGGFEPHRATAMSLISFTLAGVISAVLHRQSGELTGVHIRNLAIGLLPGAFIGGWLSARIPDVAILGALCVVSLFSGIWVVVRAPGREAAESVRLTPFTGGSVGLVVGFGSAITGTSGPVLLTPALMAFGFAARRAVVAGQLAQVVVTPAGGAGYLLQSRLDLPLTALLG